MDRSRPRSDSGVVQMDMEVDEMDSLFEGMVLFTPSQLTESEDRHHQPDADADAASETESPEDNRQSDAAPTASEPLDENLFSDLTLQTHPSSPPSTATTTTSASRKKKKRVAKRIGYGRDQPRLPDDDDEVEADADADAEPDDPQQKFEQLKTLIADKLKRARELAISVSAARKDAIRRRRKAAEDLNSASLTYSQLEKQLDEACEAEDFKAAQRISDDLAAVENEKRAFLLLLREAESHCDAVDSQMHQALNSQIDVERQCAALLDEFSTVCLSPFSFCSFRDCTTHLTSK